MAKEKKPQVDTEQKVQTKYEKKMEARRKQEEKDRREAKIWRICSIAVCVLIVAAIGVSIFASVWNKKTATKDTYLTIGSHTITIILCLRIIIYPVMVPYFLIWAWIPHRILRGSSITIP